MGYHTHCIPPKDAIENIILESYNMVLEVTVTDS